MRLIWSLAPSCAHQPWMHVLRRMRPRLEFRSVYRPVPQCNPCSIFLSNIVLSEDPKTIFCGCVVFCPRQVLLTQREVTMVSDRKSRESVLSHMPDGKACK